MENSNICTILLFSVLGGGISRAVFEELGEIILIRIAYAGTDLAYRQFRSGKKDLSKVDPQVLKVIKAGHG